jgi:hypothetical protein
MQCLDIFASSEIVIDLHTGVIDGLCGRVPLHSLRHSINHHFTPELSTPNVLLIMLLVDLKIHGIIHCTPRKFNRRFFIFDCLDYFRRNFEIEIQRNLAEEICWRFFNISWKGPPYKASVQIVRRNIGTRACFGFLSFGPV